MKKKVPHQARKSQARAAGMAKATAGRSRVFKNKKKRPCSASKDIVERLEDEKA